MAIFEYTGIVAGGTTVSGVEIGANAGVAAATLAGKGVQVLELRPAGMAPAPRPVGPKTAETPRGPIPIDDPLAGIPQRSYVATSIAGPLIGQVPLKELAFFFRQLGTMLKAGVPIVQSLGTLTRQAQSAKLRTILTETGLAVEGGLPMSAVFSRYPEVFSPVQVALLRAGENGGFLDEAAHQIADYLDRDLELRNLYKRVTFMPKLQVGASMVIIVAANAIIASVAPGGKGLSSPLTTPSTWIWLGPLIVGIFLFIRVGLANPRIKHNWDFLVALTPGWGKTMHEMAMAKWGRSFAALYRGGVPIPEAFRLAADTSGNEKVRAKLVNAPLRLQEGKGIADTLRETGAFSPIVLDMVSTGESTGNLDQMLDSMSKFYEDEASIRSQQLGQMTGVVVFLCVAVYIGYLVVSFYAGYGQGFSDQMK